MSALLAALLALGPVARQDGAGAQVNEAARQLFVVNCATCHGETGDGKGTTQLDRPARSFMDGGFSFGNTPEALFRTISTGIPGSPMPGFDTSLSEEQRKLLADYVVTLGPPIEEVKDEDMILEVRDRPIVVRGLLPSLAEGLPVHPRGLLIGDPSGITFEYQVDDVRLLALRQGGFVRRTDWTGRGGTSLEPLGKPVQLIAGGTPAALFFLGESALVARLSGTSVHGSAVELEYHLVAAGREVAHVIESPSVVSTPIGTGYRRRFVLVGVSGAADLRLRTHDVGGVDSLRTRSNSGFVREVCKLADGGLVAAALSSSQAATPGDARGTLSMPVELAPRERVELTYTSLSLREWNPTVERELEALLR